MQRQKNSQSEFHPGCPDLLNFYANYCGMILFIAVCSPFKQKEQKENNEPENEENKELSHSIFELLIQVV
jgi:hypothetical protein